MNCLLDTNILLRIVNVQSPQSSQAQTAVKQLMSQGHDLLVCPQVIEEFFVVATRPAKSRGGLGIAPAKALELIGGFQQSIPVLEEKPLYKTWLRLVETYNVSGVQAHDARIVAFLIEQKISHLLTFNDKDFARYRPEDITVISPLSLTS